MFETSDYLSWLYPAAGVYSEVFEPARNLRADRGPAIGNDIAIGGKDSKPRVSGLNDRAGDFDFRRGRSAPHPIPDQHRRGKQDKHRAQKHHSQPAPGARFFIVIPVNPQGREVRLYFFSLLHSVFYLLIATLSCTIKQVSGGGNTG